MFKFTAKKNIDEKEFERKLKESNERIKRVYEAAKVDFISLKRKFN
jgi:hypothetical protein